MSIPDVTPELPGAGWRALLALLRRAPQAGLSRALGRLADLPIPRPLRRPVLRVFARAPPGSGSPRSSGRSRTTRA